VCVHGARQAAGISPWSIPEYVAHTEADEEVAMAAIDWANVQQLRMFVYFVWAPDKGKFSGEIVYIAPMAE
jgi:hypothetical protein